MAAFSLELTQPILSKAFVLVLPLLVILPPKVLQSFSPCYSGFNSNFSSTKNTPKATHSTHPIHLSTQSICYIECLVSIAIITTWHLLMMLLARLFSHKQQRFYLVFLAACNIFRCF
jgi:hypothetical protein